MKIHIFIIIFLIFVGCDNSEINNRTNSKSKSDSSFVEAKEKNIPTSDTCNFTDYKGKKQGKWVIKKSKTKETEIKTYRNDTLNGYFSEGPPSWRSEGFYKNGKLDGIVRLYEGKNVKSIEYFENGEYIWHSNFGADSARLIPIKGFFLQHKGDTIYIKAPYKNGQIWYEGLFISTNIENETEALGIHKIYYTNGIIKGLVDYDKRTITEFDDSGRKIKTTSYKRGEPFDQPM